MVALPSQLTQPAERVGARLRDRGETVAVAEGSAVGSSRRAAVGAGRVAYYVGGAVVYTLAASRAWMAGAVEVPEGMRGATEDFAMYLARSTAVKLGRRGGSVKPALRTAEPLRRPAGHCWVAVAGPTERTQHVLTGSTIVRRTWSPSRSPRSSCSPRLT
jgi:nicotinamide mononucleotide (NMN) deamidase PncC